VTTATPAPGPVVAVGGVTVAEGSILLVRRGQPPQAGRWTIPGGRVEPNETLAHAVERELLEETGVPVRCGPLVGWVERIEPGFHYVILDFVATPTGDPAAPVAGSDAAACAWVPLADVPGLALVDGVEEFLVVHGILG